MDVALEKPIDAVRTGDVDKVIIGGAPMTDAYAQKDD